jgi:hypothetical protein
MTSVSDELEVRRQTRVILHCGVPLRLFVSRGLFFGKFALLLRGDFSQGHYSSFPTRTFTTIRAARLLQTHADLFASRVISYLAKVPFHLKIVSYNEKHASNLKIS